MKVLNLGSNIREIMLCVFFFSYFFRNERKKINSPQTSFLMLEANKVNSLTRSYSFFIKL